MVINKNIYAIVVIYNKSCENSLTLNCLKNITNLDITICDNSTKNYNNKAYAKKMGYYYINMHGNKGLAVAYNRALERLRVRTGYVCLFDDDTYVPKEYFGVLKKEITNSNADIYLPIIYDSVGVLSPCRINKFSVKREKNIKKNLNQKNITGINSAMAINLCVFKEGYFYNEEYFLDYIDHDFIREMKTKNKNIKILDVKLKQNFSETSFENKDAALNRFRIFKKDFKKFCKGSFFGKIYAIFVIMRRILKFTFKFKTLDFIFKNY